MANKIQIKRSTANAVVSGLANGELAFTQASNTLHIGLPDGSGTLRIGGAEYPGTLTANHALVANASGYIDEIRVANAVVTKVYANSTHGEAGDILSVDSSGNVFWVAANTISSSVAGSNTEVQFNDSEVLGSSAGFTYDKASNTLFLSNSALITNGVNAASITVGSNFIANTTKVTIGSGVGLTANGSVGSNGQVLVSNGTSVYWGTGTSGANTQVQFNDSGVANATSDFTFDKVSKKLYVGNSVSTAFITALNGARNITTNYNSVGGSVGVSGDLYVGTAVGGNVSVPSTGTINVGSATLNSTFWSKTANNANYLGGVLASSYVQNTDSRELSGNLTFSGANLVISGTNTYISSNTIVAGTNTVISSNVIVTGTKIDATSATLTVMDAVVSGNLTINGELTTVNTNSIQVRDSIIKLADLNDTSDTIDIGFYGLSGNASSTYYSGLVRKSGQGALDAPVFSLFVSNNEPTSTVSTSAYYALATLRAYIDSAGLVSNGTNVTITANSSLAVGITANTLSLSTALAGTEGGTGYKTTTNNAILVGNATNGYDQLSLGGSGTVLQSNGTALVYDSLDGGTF